MEEKKDNNNAKSKENKLKEKNNWSLDATNANWQISYFLWTEILHAKTGETDQHLTCDEQDNDHLNASRLLVVQDFQEKPCIVLDDLQLQRQILETVIDFEILPQG